MPAGPLVLHLEEALARSVISVAKWDILREVAPLVEEGEVRWEGIVEDEVGEGGSVVAHLGVIPRLGKACACLRIFGIYPCSGQL